MEIELETFCYIDNPDKKYVDLERVKTIIERSLRDK